MRKPRLEAFDPSASQRQPEPINMTGVVPLHPQADRKGNPSPTAQEVFSTPPPADEPAVSRYHGGMVSRYHDTTPEEAVIQAIRQAVKEFGKEAATHRFTETEKRAVFDIVYAYKLRGIRTSENEVARIAINFLFQDYQRNGDNSILHQCLVSLNQ
jgi:hypothetical protein